jgi:hypothetical protein
VRGLRLQQRVQSPILSGPLLVPLRVPLAIRGLSGLHQRCPRVLQRLTQRSHLAAHHLAHVQLFQGALQPGGLHGGRTTGLPMEGQREPLGRAQTG